MSPSSYLIIDFCTDQYIEGSGFGVYWDAESIFALKINCAFSMYIVRKTHLAEDICGVPTITPDLPKESLKLGNNLIVGGQLAVRNSYPWVGSVWATVNGESGHFCSCSLLKDQWCLTAGHCLQVSDEKVSFERAIQMKVSAGTGVMRRSDFT